MPHVEINGFSFTYEATARTFPRRRCTACGKRGGISETISQTNGGPRHSTIACRHCGRSSTVELF